MATITARVPDDLRDIICRIAREAHTTESYVLRRLIVKGLQDMGIEYRIPDGVSYTLTFTSTSDQEYLTTKSGEAIIVDLADYVRLSQYHWHIAKGHVRRHIRDDAATGSKSRKRAIERDIVDELIVERDYTVKHRNGNRLDCRRRNLLVEVSHGVKAEDPFTD